MTAPTLGAGVAVEAQPVAEGHGVGVGVEGRGGDNVAVALVDGVNEMVALPVGDGAMPDGAAAAVP